jgi:hypothetical protein
MKTHLVAVGDGYLRLEHDGERVCDLFALSSHGLWRLRRKGYADQDFKTQAEAIAAVKKWCWAVYHEIPDLNTSGGVVEIKP